MGLVGRHEKVAFYGVPSTGGTVTFNRMKNFTSLSTSKNPQEYSRHYVDEAFEQTDVTGYSPSISYAFDLDSENAVHADIVGITDGEKIGNDAVRTIIVVDLTTDGETSGKKVAFKRNFSVIPDSEGDSTDAYTYSGTFKTKGNSEKIEVAVSEDGMTITLAESN